MASSFFACAAVALSEAPSASSMSTINSRRVDAGKNCCGTKRNNASEAMNTATVTAITVLRYSTHHATSLRKRR